MNDLQILCAIGRLGRMLLTADERVDKLMEQGKEEEANEFAITFVDKLIGVYSQNEENKEIEEVSKT